MPLFSKYKNKLLKALVLIFFVLIFLFPSSTYRGARSGLLLWFSAVLPTLLPFIILSNLMVKLNITSYISRMLYPFLGKFLKLSRRGCYPLIIGILSGLPMGAKSCADLVSEGDIDLEEGHFLLFLSNNASPGFLMNFVVLHQLNLPRFRLPLFIILYGSALLSALIGRSLIRADKSIFSSSVRLAAQQVSEKQNNTLRTGSRFSFDLLDRAILNAFEIITKIGGYIILFSILAQIISSVGSDYPIFRAMSMGALEITTGVNQICTLNLPTHLKIVLITPFLSFGGLSGIAQTKSVLGTSRLSIKLYFLIKLLNALIALGLSLIYTLILSPILYP